MKTNPRTSGFTLIEVTLAMGVTLIGLLAVLGMVANGLRSSRNAVDNCIPAMIASDIFGQVRSDFHNYKDQTIDLSLITQRPSPETLTYDITGTTNGLPYYQANIFFGDLIDLIGLSAAMATNLVRVRVEVSWPGTNSPPHTNTFITQVSKLW